MLKIYDPADATNVIPLPIDDNKRYVKHVFGGADLLVFEVASNDPRYQYIVEETKVEDENNRYVVKQIDEHSDFVTVSCHLDMDDWREELIPTFRPTNALLQNVLTSILPDDWSIVGAGVFTKRTTVEKSIGEPFEYVSAYELLDPIAQAYECVFRFDTIDKVIEALDIASYTPSGQYFTDELNLKSVGYVGDSTNLVTRLYAFGKKDDDGNYLTFADINDGKAYVEDNTYSSKIISVGWIDERYTVPENLLADAQVKLAEMSKPARSYSCDTRHLGDEIWMYKIVTLIDRRRGLRVDHQIVEHKEYPNHVADTIVLSSVEKKIQTKFEQLRVDISEEVAKSQSTMKQIMDKAIEEATEKITQNKNGVFHWLVDSEGKYTELLNLADTEDPDTAQKIWRWNAGGLGHSNNGINGPYDLALLDDGSINASQILTGILTANLIQAGVLQSVDGKSFYLDLEQGILNMDAQSIALNGNQLGDFLQVSFDDSGKPMLQLGWSGNNIAFMLKNDRAGFYDLSTNPPEETTYWNNNSFRLTTLQSFQLGGIKIVAEDNGSLSFVKGDE